MAYAMEREPFTCAHICKLVSLSLGATHGQTFQRHTAGILLSSLEFRRYFLDGFFQYIGRR